MSRWRVSPVLLLIVLVLTYDTSLTSQTIPLDPRALSFETLEFDPPSAERHRHVLSNGVVVFVVEDQNNFDWWGFEGVAIGIRYRRTNRLQAVFQYFNFNTLHHGGVGVAPHLYNFLLINLFNKSIPLVS